MKTVSEISQLAMDIAASLWIKPATFEELYDRKIKSLEMYVRTKELAIGAFYDSFEVVMDNGKWAEIIDDKSELKAKVDDIQKQLDELKAQL